MGGVTLSEIEDRAKQMIQAACPDSLMEFDQSICFFLRKRNLFLD
jgi:hypothetical protein